MSTLDLHILDPRRFPAYKNDFTYCFCQVRLDSGERVLVSGAMGEIKLMKLDMRGMIPLQTIGTLDAFRLAQLFKPVRDSASDPFLHPLDMTSLLVSTMQDISDLERFLKADVTTQMGVVTRRAEAILRLVAGQGTR